MIGKILATALMLALAFDAIWEDALGSGYIVGVVFLFLAGATWFKWEAIVEAFRSAKDESDIPIIRLASKVISGMSRQVQPRRHSPSN